eukprot:TRINITY_DN8599_c0_g1_i1.p2 TRINITY_DN8599_c0_g1~~TRINITY_DN8599_c0_g1_i1.p2  ORF type:complete len:129 (-),score=26.66 TRINITY_DN8599_c0_g1_i1:1267-1653(-)
MSKEELFISVHKAWDLFNTEFLTRQDPYVLVYYATHLVFETKVATNEGTSPEWNENFKVKLDPKHDTMRFIVMNKNTLVEDAEIGVTQVHFHKARETGKETIEADVFHGNEPKGKLQLTFYYPFVKKE